MCIENAKELSLKGDTFSALIDDFDLIIGKTIKNMEAKGADEATVTVKLKIGLEKEAVYNRDDTDEITKPTFSHDITSVMQVKAKKSGSMTGDYELVYDEEEEKFVMKKVDDGQVSLFEADSADTDETSENADETLTMFTRLLDHIGEKVTITESMGNYTARTENGDIVLSSASGEKYMYCPAEILEKHLGHSLVVCAYRPEATSADDVPDYDAATIECNDCFETIVTAYKDGDFAPDEEEGDDVPSDDEEIDEKIDEFNEDGSVIEDEDFDYDDADEGDEDEEDF